ncbi:MAG: response regulator, partial [Marinilabiliales bacterium]
KSIMPEITIVAQTAHAMADDRKRSLDMGCDDYISKPILQEELHRLLNKYL